MVQNDKELSERLKEALKGGTSSLCEVLESLGLNKIKNIYGTEELSIDMKTNELYISMANKHKIISYQKPLRLKNLGLLSYTAETECGKIAGIFVGEYSDLAMFLKVYEQIKE